MQDRGVEHSDGSGGDGDATIPNAAIPLHAVGGAGGHHRGRHAWPHRLRGRPPFVARGQIRLCRVHDRLRRCRLRQHPDRTRSRGTNQNFKK